MYSPLHFETISMGLPIVYFKGSKVEFSTLLCNHVPEDCFNLSLQCRPCSISSGSSLFAKVLGEGFQYTKG